MTPGTNAIGKQRLRKWLSLELATMDVRQAILDETYGLIEVIEEAAMIYSQVGAQGGKILQEITDVQLQEVRNTLI